MLEYLVAYLKNRKVNNNGNITVAVECFTKTIQCYEKVYDEKSNVALQLADAEQALANIYDDTKEYDQAEKLYKSAIYVLENVDDEIKASVILKDKGTDLKIKRFLKLKGIVKEG